MTARLAPARVQRHRNRCVPIPAALVFACIDQERPCRARAPIPLCVPVRKDGKKKEGGRKGEGKGGKEKGGGRRCGRGREEGKRRGGKGREEGEKGRTGGGGKKKKKDIKEGVGCREGEGEERGRRDRRK